MYFPNIVTILTSDVEVSRDLVPRNEIYGHSILDSSFYSWRSFYLFSSFCKSSLSLKSEYIEGYFVFLHLFGSGGTKEKMSPHNLSHFPFSKSDSKSIFPRNAFPLKCFFILRSTLIFFLSITGLFFFLL